MKNTIFSHFFRQVVVNGKLLTLVPFQGPPGSQPRPGMTTLQHRPPPMVPSGKMPLPRGMSPNALIRNPVRKPIIVHPSQGYQGIRTPIRAPLRMPPMGARLPLPSNLANLEDVQCDFCSVKLPKSILHMHIKMRHSDIMQPPKPVEKGEGSNPVSANDSEQVQCTPEITLFDENDDNDTENDDNVGDQNNKSELVEMNPSNKAMDQEPEPEQDPLADPLAV